MRGVPAVKHRPVGPHTVENGFKRVAPDVGGGISLGALQIAAPYAKISKVLSYLSMFV
jgi:hypothetical protein